MKAVLIGATLLVAVGIGLGACSMTDGGGSYTPAPTPPTTPQPKPTPTPQPQPGPGPAVNAMCRGTEPFWNLEINDTTGIYSRPGNEVVYAEEVIKILSSKSGDKITWWGETRDGKRVGGTMIPGQCSDGMSDQRYPYRFDGEAPDLGHVVGCCL